MGDGTAIAFNRLCGDLNRSHVRRAPLSASTWVSQLSRERDGQGRPKHFVTAVIDWPELFRRGASANPDDLAKAMRRIEAEAARMGALVDELLLLLARLDEGRPLERAPVDLAALAADAVADARAVEPERPVTLERDGPVVVRGDADRLRQVLANLVANVRQHTPPATPMRVRACLADQGRIAVLEVADGGPGLTGEQPERVFERFWRHGSAGAGLGLSIVAASVSAGIGGLPRPRDRRATPPRFTAGAPRTLPHAGGQVLPRAGVCDDARSARARIRSGWRAAQRAPSTMAPTTTSTASSSRLARPAACSTRRQPVPAAWVIRFA